MSWVKYANVGDKVVCIAEFNDDTGIPSEFTFNTPKKGEIYTIREIHADEFGVFLRFVEIANKPRRGDLFEADFQAEGFRPVQTKPTSIEVFTAMLDKTPARVLEDV